MYLKESNPVIAGPDVLGTDGVMAFNPALWEVAAADIPELHFPGGFHDNKLSWYPLHLHKLPSEEFWNYEKEPFDIAQISEGCALHYAHGYTTPVEIYRKVIFFSVWL